MDFCRAFSQGCGGKMSTNPGILLPGDIAGFFIPELYGILNTARLQKRNWYYGDKAYFGRHKYWRITKNAFMYDLSNSHTPERFEKLGIEIKPWRSGSEILLCPQSDTYFRLHGMRQQEWIDKTTCELRQHTDRKIRIHYKLVGDDTERHFEREIRNAWAVVVYSSMAGAQAAIHGVPCFATNSDCVSAKFGTTDLSLIENPCKPDNRAELAWGLADNQWTLDEIKRGMAWEAIK